ncbi:hypothetical protein GCM10022252_10040 [Streptosporangium oxazolinicum]|uniref:Uncharacterized protein n=1 Tax=Streptosporangium oxazolinicum TaxID=909287 RepID=A0ABP8AFM9_9ACTN
MLASAGPAKASGGVTTRTPTASARSPAPRITPGRDGPRFVTFLRVRMNPPCVRPPITSGGDRSAGSCARDDYIP